MLNRQRYKAAIFSALVTLAFASFAAEQVGKLRDVEGSVTVMSASGVVKGANGTPLTANSRVMVGSGAKATLMLAEGCVIPLKANQYIALNPTLTCSQQFAAAQQLAAPYRVAQFGQVPNLTPSSIPSIPVVGVTALGFLLLDILTERDLVDVSGF